jgi:hypothetical protein
MTCVAVERGTLYGGTTNIGAPDGGVVVEKVGSMERIVVVQKWAVGDTCNLFLTTEKGPVVDTSYPFLAVKKRATIENVIELFNGGNEINNGKVDGGGNVIDFFGGGKGEARKVTL